MTNRVFKSIIAILLMLTVSVGLFSCSPKPSEDTFKEAHNQAVEKFVDQIKQGYDNLEANDLGNMATSANISMELSDEMLSMLRSSTAEDWSWLNDATISMTESTKDDKTAIDLALGYNGSELVSLKSIVDTLNGNIYMAIPLLTNKYLKLNMNELIGSDMSTGEIASAPAAVISNNIDEYLPSEEVLENLILKYYGMIMDGITDIAHEEGSLTVNGVTQECIIYKTELTVGQLGAIAMTVLGRLKADVDIRNYIYDIANKLIESDPESYADTSASDIYGDFTSSIDDMLEDIMLIDAADTEKTAFRWTSYMTERSEIIGTELEFINDEESYFVFSGRAQNGESIGVQIYAGTSEVKEIEIEGKLTESKNMQSGTYEISVEGESMLFIDLENIDLKQLEKGYLNGSITLCPSKGLIELISDEFDIEGAGSGLVLASLSIKLDLEQKDDKNATVKAALLNSGSPYFTLTVESKISEGVATEIPSNNNVTTNAEAWAADMDFNALVESLESSEMPDYIVDTVSYYVMLLQYSYAGIMPSYPYGY